MFRDPVGFEVGISTAVDIQYNCISVDQNSGADAFVAISPMGQSVV